MHLISHLDLMRIFERALRRSQLSVSYSGGFHPLPRLQIALALPLGVEAFGEWMTIDFHQKVEPEFALNALQKTLPSGINLLTAESTSIKKENLSQQLEKAIWSFKLEFSAGGVALKEIQNCIQKIVSSKTLIWSDKDKKGNKRERDFRPELKSLSFKITERLTDDILKNIELELVSYISPEGRNLKPEYVKGWMAKHLKTTPKMTELKRNELILKKC